MTFIQNYERLRRRRSICSSINILFQAYILSCFFKCKKRYDEYYKDYKDIEEVEKVYTIYEKFKSLFKKIKN